MAVTVPSLIGGGDFLVQARRDDGDLGAGLQQQAQAPGSDLATADDKDAPLSEIEKCREIVH